MNTLRRILFILLGLLLLVGPTLLRVGMGYNARSYAPPQALTTSVAATPVPTPTAVALALPVVGSNQSMRPGPVIVDLAHGNTLSRNQYEPLASALARRGIGLRFWISNVDTLGLTSILDYPDQSEDLAALLKDASALVVSSPFFFWSRQEIALVDRFVADGGRLLLVSDPDMAGDFVQAINELGEPFGVVFNDDYLYDTTENDDNFVHIFQGEFLGDAANLAGSTVALYGARSISGEIAPLALSLDSTLSSVREGVSRFITLAQGGVEARGTAGRVLALGDFDVLTASYVERHDNNLLMEFVAAFLAGGEREKTVIDFPAYLGKEVALIIGDANGVDAAILQEAARLQGSIEQSGRVLTLSGTSTLTNALALTGNAPEDAPGADAAALQSTAETDVILLADYTLADEKIGLLGDLGFSLVEEVVVPESDESESNESESDESATGEPESSAAITVTAPVTTSATTTTPETTDTPTPIAEPTGEAESETDGEAGDEADDEASDEPDDEAADDAADEAAPPAQPGEPITDTAPISATPAAEVTPAVEATPAPDAAAPQVMPPSLTSTLTPTVTPTPTMTPTATPTPTPQITTYLQTADGLRFLAPQTVLIVQRPLGKENRLVAVLGSDSAGIRSGIGRLLSGDYAGCVTGPELVVCSYADGKASDASAERSAASSSATRPGDATATPPVSTTPEAPSPMGTPVPGEDSPIASVLVIDDDDVVGPNETSEADLYLRVLAAAGYQPDLWSIAGNGVPKRGDLSGYKWVIWSAGAYEAGGPAVSDLDPVLAYINEGGRLTISSRRPFFGMSNGAATVIADVIVENDIPPLVEGLPTEPVALTGSLPPVVPLEMDPDDGGPQIALRRGPASESAGAPLIFVATDDQGDEATGARLMVIGMSLTWLPQEVGDPLVRNIAAWMLAE